jgi:NADPH:quinone reductase-like Zn-dependent oxidoreductase
MSWQAVQIRRFGGPEVLELVEQPEIPRPGPGEALLKVLAAGTGFTDTFIRNGRYPDVRGPLPLTLGYELVGVVEEVGPNVVGPRVGQVVADMCVTGGYAQYAIRPSRDLVPVPPGVDLAEAACIPLAYLTAYQLLTRHRSLKHGERILVVGASGTVGTALLDLARHMGLEAIGTASARNRSIVEVYGATFIDYRAEGFVAAVRRLTSGRGVDEAFDAVGGSHFRRTFECLAPGGWLVGYGSHTMAQGAEGLFSAGLGLAQLQLRRALPFLFGGRRAAWYAITSRRKTHPEDFRADTAALFELLRVKGIHPTVVDRLPLSAAREVHARIDAGGLGGKIVLLPWGTGST